MAEPVLTWNLFWTTVIVPASMVGLGWYLNKLEKRRDEKHDERERLVEENKRLVAAEMLAWRERFTTTLCGVKKTVESIDSRLDAKRETSDCTKMNDDVWAAIDGVRQRQHDDLLLINGVKSGG